MAAPSGLDLISIITYPSRCPPVYYLLISLLHVDKFMKFLPGKLFSLVRATTLTFSVLRLEDH